MKRASYREAIRWVVYNDDTDWLDDDEPVVSVTVSLIADIFDVTHDKIIADLRREMKKRDA